MGDPRRFDKFADVIFSEFGALTSAPVADVAGGKGGLQGALRARGFSDITSWDKRQKYAGPRRCYHYGYFDFRSAPRSYGLVVGMHPDEGTDHIVCYAIKHRVPFAVCPCCVKPSATKYPAEREYRRWCDFLAATAEYGNFRLRRFDMRMHGCAHVILGRPR
jgi:hypothetical protein